MITFAPVTTRCHVELNLIGINVRRTGAAVYIANNYLQHSIDINTFNYYYIYLLIRIVSLHIALIDFIVEILDIFRELIKTFGLHEH